MGYYGTIQAVKDAMPKQAKYIKPDGELTDPRDIPESVVIGILQDYTDRVNAALGGVYAVPFDEAPSVIKQIVVDLAVVRLYQRYYTTVNQEENMNMLSIRKDAKQMLADLVSGTSTLPGFTRIDISVIPDEEELGGSDESLFNMEDPTTWQDKI